MELNRNMTNEELLRVAGVKEAVDAGKLVIIDKVQTSRPEFTNLYFIGKVEGLSSSNTNVSQLAAALLGWGDNYLRSIQNADTNIANQFQVGSSIEGTIRVIDSFEPAFDGQQPRIDRNGQQLLNNGRPIYRSTQICTHDELNQLGHSTIEVTERVGQQAQQPVGQNVGQSQQQVGNQSNVGANNNTPNPASNVQNLVNGQA